jgi:hydroxymethylbilane synthase
LGIECRRGDMAVRALLEPLDNPAAHRAICAERAALADLEGGCALPMAAWGRDVEHEGSDTNRPALVLEAAVFDADGRDCVKVRLQGPCDDPNDLGHRVALALRDRGAYALLGRAGSSARLPHSTPPDVGP